MKIAIEAVSIAIMKLIALLSLLVAPLMSASAQDHPAYAAGQVWEYRTRTQDAGSLLKIQQVESDPAGKPIYHISLVGVRIDGMPGDALAHLPVSSETLDASVTGLAARKGEFPDPSEGIAVWRENEGGVFTIPIAEIVGIVQDAYGSPPPAN